jgi:hypothetical protein
MWLAGFTACLGRGRSENGNLSRKGNKNFLRRKAFGRCQAACLRWASGRGSRRLRTAIAAGPRRRPSREEAPSRRERHGLGAGRPRDTAEDGDGPAVASGDEDDRDLSLKDDPQFSDRGPWYSAFRSPMMRRRDPEELRRLLARLARQIPKKPSAPSVRRFAIRTSSR